MISNKSKDIAAWQQEKREMEENICRHLQILNNSGYATQLSQEQQTHKDMLPLLNKRSNIPDTTIRVCAKCGQVGHW